MSKLERVEVVPLSDSELVGFALDLLEENKLLENKKGLRFMLEVIAERRERPRAA